MSSLRGQNRIVPLLDHILERNATLLPESTDTPVLALLRGCLSHRLGNTNKLAQGLKPVLSALFLVRQTRRVKIPAASR